MTDPIVPEDDRRVRYVVSNPSGQGTFEVDFPVDPIYDSGSIVGYGISVYVNDEEVAAADYTFDPDASEVVLDTDAAQNDIVVLEGDTFAQRDLNYPLRGGLPSARLNNEANKFFYMIQELKRDFSRVVQLAKSLAGVAPKIVETPVADCVPIYNADLNLENGPSLSDLAVITAALGDIGTVADNIADVNTVADNIGDVGTCADNMAAIIAAPGAAAAAAASETAAANYAAALKATSTTSLAIGTGSKEFTTQANKQFAAGQWIVASSDADPTNYMHGYVDSYAGTALVMEVTNVGGAGTLDDWTIQVSGTRGATGAAGAAGSNGANGDDGIDRLGNRIINPSGSVYQRTVAATADDAYFADRWYMLTQTNTVTPSRLTNPENGYRDGVRITQSQASAQRFGFAQIIEGRDCVDMRGSSVVFSPRIRASAAQAIRYAILEWTGTEDAVTSDVVNDWTNGTYTGGSFFNSTTLNVLAVGVVTPGANTWQTLADITATVGASANNLILMVWTEGTAAQNFTLDFDNMVVQKAAVSSATEPRSYAEELVLCQRFYEAHTFASQRIAPDTAAGYGSCVYGDFKVTKRGSVTFTKTNGAGAVGTNTGSADTNGWLVTAGGNLGDNAAIISYTAECEL